MEHRPWVGPEYDKGIAGQKIAIVGYSHHQGGDKRPDGPRFTIDTVGNIMADEWSILFYTKIQGYFEMDRLFWNKVLFFNFLPETVGSSENKYALRKEWHDRARARALRIIEKYEPEKVFVFSRKGWKCFPDTIENAKGSSGNRLLPSLPKPTWGTYTTSSGHQVLACGLSHPERAKGEDLKLQVKKFLALKAE